MSQTILEDESDGGMRGENDNLHCRPLVPTPLCFQDGGLVLET